MYKKSLKFYLAFILIAAFNFTGCATSSKGLTFYENKSDQTHLEPQQLVKVQYLGVAGYILDWQGERIMIAPSFTNPSLLQLAPLHEIKTNEALVDKLLPPVSDVKTILAGHAHYDHLMDVPYIMQKHAPDSVIYGSNTVGHIMAAVVDQSRIVKMNAGMAIGDVRGKWYYTPSGKIRIMAIKSEHAPHFMGIKVYKGAYNEDLKELPKTANDWVEGQTLAFLIDFLDDKGRVKFRTHFQDAASTPPLGFIPKLLPEDQHPVNLAILCVGNYNQVKGYPQGIIKNTQAENIVLGHWEDFFGNNKLDTQILKVVRLVNIKHFIARVEKSKPKDSKWILPKPFDEMVFETN